jgi:hypothetical protein
LVSGAQQRTNRAAERGSVIDDEHPHRQARSLG